MAIIKSLFRTPRHQKFDYKPMYYSPEKEEREKRMAELKALGKESDDPEAAKARISSGLRRGFAGDRSFRQQQVRNSNRTLIKIILVLVVVVIYLLKSFIK